MQHSLPAAALCTHFAHTGLLICSTANPADNPSSLCHSICRNNHGCRQWWWQRLDECCWWTCPLIYCKMLLKCTKVNVHVDRDFFSLNWTVLGQPLSPHDDVDNHAANQQSVQSWQCAAAHIWISAAAHTVCICWLQYLSRLYVIMPRMKLHTASIKNPI